MSETADYLTPEQVSARFCGRITVRTLANWRSKKIGPPFRKIGGRVLYPFQQLLAWEMLDRFVERAVRVLLGWSGLEWLL